MSVGFHALYGSDKTELPKDNPSVVPEKIDEQKEISDSREATLRAAKLISGGVPTTRSQKKANKTTKKPTKKQVGKKKRVVKKTTKKVKKTVQRQPSLTACIKLLEALRKKPSGRKRK